jgi:hypothetical protein
VNALVQVAGTGAACLLIHRGVLEKVRAEHGDVWFDRVTYASGLKVAEDLSFCYRVNSAGFGVFVHTGVRTTHHKAVWLSETDYWRSHPVPPATDEVAVIVPAMRYVNAERFMTSLRASTGLATAYAVAADGEEDAVTAWMAAGAEIIRGKGTTFAARMNAGHKATEEPWLFIVGDDVIFRPGWLDHAQHVANTQGAQVVGTNDLGNPRVMAGEHATHMLISRSYVDEQGASWDGPKNVCHEGYRHWYVDDEIVTAAKQRGVWAMATGSIVEHLHPAWGKAEMDPVYELGQKHAKQDQKRFRERLARHAH